MYREDENPCRIKGQYKVNLFCIQDSILIILKLLLLPSRNLSHTLGPSTGTNVLPFEFFQSLGCLHAPQHGSTGNRLYLDSPYQMRLRCNFSTYRLMTVDGLLYSVLYQRPIPTVPRQKTETGENKGRIQGTENVKTSTSLYLNPVSTSHIIW